MPSCLSSIICLPLIGRLGQRAPGQPTGKILPHSPIHTLNDYVLLNIFYLYRLDFPGEYTKDGYPNPNCAGHGWWYKLAQVCQWWRYLILASPSQLDLHLLCTNGVPIADMLAHSPPLPLTIYYHEWDRETTELDEEDILLALRHSDRVHYISLNLPSPKLRKIITTMDEQFPILERLYIISRTKGDASLVLPRTFQAPHLHHLALWHVALPIRSPLLTTTVGLVTLILKDIPPSAYFPPSSLLTWLSLMPQLEMLVIGFHSPLPSRDVESQMLDTPIMAHITLPSLRWFSFNGVSTYLDGLLAWISTPVLGTFWAVFFNQLIFTVPSLLQFMGTLENLRFSDVLLAFDSNAVVLKLIQPGEVAEPPFAMQLNCRHLDWQVASAIQILTALQPVLSVVEQLILSHEEHSQSSEWHNEVDRTLWRQLLRPFNDLKTLHVPDELIGKLAHSLQTDDGELPLELLPNLKTVRYSGGGDAPDALTPFLDERQVAGHPVNLIMSIDQYSRVVVREGT